MGPTHKMVTLGIHGCGMGSGSMAIPLLLSYQGRCRTARLYFFGQARQSRIAENRMSCQRSYINAPHSLLQFIYLHHFETLTVAQTGQPILLSFLWAPYMIMSLRATSFRLKNRTCSFTTTIHEEQLYNLPSQRRLTVQFPHGIGQIHLRHHSFLGLPSPSPSPLPHVNATPAAS